MAFPANAERDALATETMTSLSYEEGLEEIDSFFNSSPDGRNSTVGEHVNDPALDNSNAPVAEDTAASASSTVRTQEDAKHTNGEDAPHEPDRAADADEFATLMEDLDQVTASETSPSNPKGRINFILNNVTSHPPKAAQPASSDDKSVVGELDDARPQESLPLELNEESVLKEDKSHTTSAEAIASPATKTRDASSIHEPPQPQPPSLSEPAPVALASFHAEKGLALLSPRRGRPIEPPHSSTTKSPPKNTTQSSPSLLPSLPSKEKLLPATPSQHTPDEAAMSGNSSPPQKSPAIPSSAGKSSLMEEMRSEEEESSGLIRSQTGRMEQPNLVAVIKEDQSAHERALSGQHIIEGADTAPQKAGALTTRAEERVKLSPEVSDITDAEETGEDIEDVEAASAVQEPVPKPPGKAKNKVESKAPAAKATKATKVTKKTIEKKQEVGPVPKRCKSGRNQRPMQYDADALEDADEPDIKAPPKQTVPAKRKAKSSPAPQPKRAKKESRPTTRASEDSAMAVSKPAQAASTIPSRVRRKGGQPMGKFEQKNLRDAWSDPEKVTMGPRKTRGQKKEEEKKLPNAGRAAKERHKMKPA
jgi:hypothetical protein